MTEFDLTQRERFYADAWTDDWSDLCDALGIDTQRELEVGDFNSRQLRKLVRVWVRDRPDGWLRVDAAIEELLTG